MQETSCEKITWKVYVPEKASDFPCMFCLKRLATLRVKYRDGALDLNLVMCEICYSEGPDYINTMIHYRGGVT